MLNERLCILLCEPFLEFCSNALWEHPHNVLLAHGCKCGGTWVHMLEPICAHPKNCIFVWLKDCKPSCSYKERITRQIIQCIMYSTILQTRLLRSVHKLRKHKNLGFFTSSTLQPYVTLSGALTTSSFVFEFFLTVSFAIFKYHNTNKLKFLKKNPQLLDHTRVEDRIC